MWPGCEACRLRKTVAQPRPASPADNNLSPLNSIQRTPPPLLPGASYSHNTRRDRSRGIRDEATACEPEVVSRERTWPPRPVSQPSRATGRPFGSKYDNIDQNKDKKEGPGGVRGQTGSRNMAATRFFDSATQTSYLTSNTSQCPSHTVTQFYSVNITSRPKCTTTSGFPNPLQV